MNVKTNKTNNEYFCFCFYLFSIRLQGLMTAAYIQVFITFVILYDPIYKGVVNFPNFIFKV